MSARRNSRIERVETAPDIYMALKGRVTPCVPFEWSLATRGAHGVTRPTVRLIHGKSFGKTLAAGKRCRDIAGMPA